MKKILMSVLVVVVALTVVGVGTSAQFTDSETATGNTFTGGTLDLKIDDDPDGGTTDWVDDDKLRNLNEIFGTALNCLAPGAEANLWIGIKNAGCVDGIADLHFTVTDSLENGFAEPETYGTGEVSDGAGELCQNIDVKVYYPGDTTNLVKEGTLAALSCTDFDLGALDADSESSVRIVMSIDSSVGNEIMTDICKVDIEFTLHQPTP